MIRVQDLHLSDLSVLGVVLTMTFSIASSLLELDDAQVQAHIRQNLILLEDAARARNFAVRDDSTLAWNFCTDRNGLAVQADELQECSRSCPEDHCERAATPLLYFLEDGVALCPYVRHRGGQS